MEKRVEGYFHAFICIDIIYTTDENFTKIGGLSMEKEHAEGIFPFFPLFPGFILIIIIIIFLPFFRKIWPWFNKS